MNRIRLFALTLLLAVSASYDALAEELSTVIQICAICHGVDGSGTGFEDVPIIAGTPAGHIEEAVYAYQDEARRCVTEPAMCIAVERLTEEEVAEAADHYSSMPRVSSGEPFNKHLAAAGEKIHAKHCSKCHVPPDDPKADAALGIPLQGQRSRYLEFAFESYMNGDRLTLVQEMAAKLVLLDDDDIEALIHYYASYRP